MRYDAPVEFSGAKSLDEGRQRLASRQRRRLCENDVHIWMVDLRAVPETIRGYSQWLTADERARAERFRRSQDCRRFIVRRAWLRNILGEYLDEPPGLLRFGSTEHGKPYLAAATDLKFSVSHSEDLSVFAFAFDREVGVDVERIRSDLDLEQMASGVLSEVEQIQFRALPPDLRLEAFFRCWSCKEAFLKATGTGLSRSLGEFDVIVHPAEPARIVATRPDATEAGRWSLRAFRARDDYQVALAVSGRNWELTVFDDGDHRAVC
jgi:4'-phosphopantetheinyl transferase